MCCRKGVIQGMLVRSKVNSSRFVISRCSL